MDDNIIFHAISIITSQCQATTDDIIQATTVTNDLIFSLNGLDWCISHFSPHNSPSINFFILKTIYHWISNPIQWDLLPEEFQHNINQLLFQNAPLSISTGQRIDQQYSTALSQDQVYFFLHVYPSQWPSFWIDFLSRGPEVLPFIHFFSNLFPSRDLNYEDPTFQQFQIILDYMKDNGPPETGTSDLSYLLNFCINHITNSNKLYQTLAFESLSSLIPNSNPENNPILNEEVLSHVIQAISNPETAENSLTLLQSLVLCLHSSHPDQLASIITNYNLSELINTVLDTYWDFEPTTPSDEQITEEIKEKAANNLQNKLNTISIENNITNNSNITNELTEEQISHIMKEIYQESAAEVKAHHFNSQNTQINPASILASAGRFIGLIISRFVQTKEEFSQFSEQFFEIAQNFVPLAIRLLNHPNEECSQTTILSLGSFLARHIEISSDLLPPLILKYSLYLQTNPIGELPDSYAEIQNILINIFHNAPESFQPFADSVLSTQPIDFYNASILFRIVYQTYLSNSQSFNLENPIIKMIVQAFTPYVIEIGSDTGKINEVTLNPIYFSFRAFIEIYCKLPIEQQCQIEIHQQIFDSLYAIFCGFKSMNEENDLDIENNVDIENRFSDLMNLIITVIKITSKISSQFSMQSQNSEVIQNDYQALQVTPELITSFLSLGDNGARAASKLISILDEKSRCEAIESVIQMSNNNLSSILRFLSDQNSIDPNDQPNLFTSISSFYESSLQIAKSDDSLFTLYIDSLYKSLKIYSLDILSQLEPIGNESAISILNNLNLIFKNQISFLRSYIPKLGKQVPQILTKLLFPTFSILPNLPPFPNMTFSQYLSTYPMIPNDQKVEEFMSQLSEQDSQVLMQIKADFEAKRVEFGQKWVPIASPLIESYSQIVAQVIDEVSTEEWDSKSEMIKEMERLVHNYFILSSNLLPFLLYNRSQNLHNIIHNSQNIQNDIINTLFSICNAVFSLGFPKIINYPLLLVENEIDMPEYHEFMVAFFTQFLEQSIMFPKIPLFASKPSDFLPYATKLVKIHSQIYHIAQDVVIENVNRVFQQNAPEYLQFLENQRNMPSTLLKFFANCFAE